MPLIDTEKAWKTAQRIYSDPVLLHAIKNVLDSTETIEAAPVVHGQCKFCEDYDKFSEIVCYLPTDNGDAIIVPLNYCPNCGARMDGDGGV